MGRPKLSLVVFIALVTFLWAAPNDGAAHLIARNSEPPAAVRPARFRDERGRGLLINVWIGAAGPFAFAIDTGAGTTLIRSQILQRATLSATPTRSVTIGGLTGSTTTSNQRTFLNKVALGDPGNLLPTGHQALVVPTLPTGVDGILDPTEAFAPSGYVIDLPNKQIEPFDGRLRLGDEPVGGTVVRWVKESGSNRPFVRLSDNRLALIDTGSGFGLALTYDAIVTKGKEDRQSRGVRDVSGGSVNARRVAPTTVSIGSLVLQKVPTDVLVGVHENAPVILGRDALYPFRITFDPVSRLIEIRPSGGRP